MGSPILVSQKSSSIVRVLSLSRWVFIPFLVSLYFQHASAPSSSILPSFPGSRRVQGSHLPLLQACSISPTWTFTYLVSFSSSKSFFLLYPIFPLYFGVLLDFFLCAVCWKHRKGAEITLEEPSFPHSSCMPLWRYTFLSVFQDSIVQCSFIFQ